MNPIIETGSNKQLFIDDFVIHEAVGVTRHMHQPRKYIGNPIMIPLYPWEGKVSLYGTVWHYPDGEFRMWYQGYGGNGVPGMAKDNNDSPWKNFNASNLLYVIGYATSHNGIHWERPNLGLIDYKGSKDNNLVLSDAAFANVIEDHCDPDPGRRYKSLFFEARDPSGTPNMGDGVSVAFSPDGIRWTKYEKNPVIKRSSDSHMLLGWDELHSRYVSYCRPSLHAGNKIRRIGRAESDDFINWSSIKDVLAPDNEDPIGTEFYGMPVFKYEDLYIGQLLAYHAPPEEQQIRFEGTTDIQLTSSRDGISWGRIGNRKSFIPNGPPGSIDHGGISASRQPVLMGNELWFYYSCSDQSHGVTGRSGTICLAKLRLDGFVSMDARTDIGTLTTQVMHCKGGLLSINAVAKNGMVSVAILDESGIQYNGYSKQECAIFNGDFINHTMTWKDNLSLEKLKGKNIRLKFYLRDASLYSFSIVPS